MPCGQGKQPSGLQCCLGLIAHCLILFEQQVLSLEGWILAVLGPWCCACERPGPPQHPLLRSSLESTYFSSERWHCQPVVQWLRNIDMGYPPIRSLAPRSHNKVLGVVQSLGYTGALAETYSTYLGGGHSNCCSLLQTVLMNGNWTLSSIV